MKETRLSNFVVVLGIIVLGILSRTMSFIPLFVGDMLYAIMVYFGIRFLLFPVNRAKTAVLALLFCYCIEALQLCDAEWLIALRNTLFGRYVLGQGFLWSDLLAYSFGVAIAYYVQIILGLTKNKI